MIEVETKGNCSVAGRSGEMASCTQLLPSTWNLYSKQILGYTPEFNEVNEKYVVARKIENWLQQGLSVEGIALAWNAGERATQCSSGTNDWGVYYDSCKHVQKVVYAYKEISINN